MEQHIDNARLIALSREAFISDDAEAAHLKSCERCYTRLRLHANKFRAEKLHKYKPDPEDKSLPEA
jgi:hypothetical protein